MSVLLLLAVLSFFEGFQCFFCFLKGFGISTMIQFFQNPPNGSPFGIACPHLRWKAWILWRGDALQQMQCFLAGKDFAVMDVKWKRQMWSHKFKVFTTAWRRVESDQKTVVLEMGRPRVTISRRWGELWAVDNLAYILAHLSCSLLVILFFQRRVCVSKKLRRIEHAEAPSM